MPPYPKENSFENFSMLPLPQVVVFFAESGISRKTETKTGYLIFSTFNVICNVLYWEISVNINIPATLHSFDNKNAFRMRLTVRNNVP